MKIKQLLVLVLIVLCGNILLTFTHLPSYLGFVQKEETQIRVSADNSEITSSALKEEILVLESQLLGCKLEKEELGNRMKDFESLLDEKYIEIDRLSKELNRIKGE